MEIAKKVCPDLDIVSLHSKLSNPESYKVGINAVLIPEFKEYILIDQYRYYVEQFYQHNNGEWLFKASESDKDALRFYSVDFQMSLLDIYQRIDFNLSE